MSYGVSGALQAAIYRRLNEDGTVAATVGAHVYDAVPAGPLPGLFIALGAERVRDASDQSGAGAWHDFEVSIVTDGAGFQAAKRAAAAASDALCAADLALTRGRLVSLRFLRAKAARDRDGRRRIDMTFRARVEDDPYAGSPQTTE
ncbi:DUF3168 domain-containing protein [Roseivivax isoporae]|uniref:Gene transfer agent protein n=1 Tax=Roseivivax isoporae LMG 25204 TaxID=1449351 RepID=X7F611_9RHOB|nr:DUF3168 domain-containing protein [Roseivivax isoporae]ETX28245.1 gene transfer agent protein [Roseivivax isoporae LMG 25204]